MVVTSLLLIFINYFTIKTLSALRAYTEGASHFAKAQKNATRYLIMYVYSENPEHWRELVKELKVIEGDSLARIGMSHGGDPKMIKENLLAGRNHPDDVDNLVWLFQSFHEIAFMNKAIQVWEEADRLIGQKYEFALQIRDQVKAGGMDLDAKEEAVNQINDLTLIVNKKENEFSFIIGEASRTLNGYLFYFNIFLILLIVGSGGFLTIVMISRLNEKNRDLINTNSELDKFVYSASHDLRAPITSIKGLIEISKLEEDEGKKRQYLDLMMDTLNKQDHFIREIIDFSRNKRSVLKVEEINIAALIESSIQQHRYMEGADKIAFSTNFSVKVLHSDTLRLEIVLNNIISNAIKYSDKRKTNQFVKISTERKGSKCIISIEDNGIGITPRDQQRVFDMFFASEHNSMNSGLGLYITKETVAKLGGSITVESEKNSGTTFRVTLPDNYDKQV